MKHPLTVLAVIIALALLFWRVGRPSLPETERRVSSQSKIENRESRIAFPVDLTNLATELNSPGRDIAADLRIVSTMLDTYRSNFPREGNPVGNNREITAALAGDNRLRLAFIPQTHPAINRAGELCDRWGTPFFFHAESGTQMEVRSAGPDKKLFTPDDAIFSP